MGKQAKGQGADQVIEIKSNMYMLWFKFGFDLFKIMITYDHKFETKNI